MSFDGSIFAEIGADTRAYERAMNEIAVMTKQAFDNAQKAAVNSSNQMIQKIGQLMNELASNSSTLGQKIGQGFKGGLNIALGEIHRIASNIGQRLPEPIRKGFLNAYLNIKSVLGLMKSDLSALGGHVSSVASKINAALAKVFHFDLTKAIKSPKAMFVELNGAADAFATGFAAKIHKIGSVFTNLSSSLPGPFSRAFNSIGTSLAGFEARVLAVGGKITSALGNQVLNPIMQSWSSLFTGLTAKANSFADRISNTLGGKLIGKVSTLSSKISSGLGNAFQQAGSKATNALMGIVNHTNQAASATNNLIKTALGISAAYAGFNFIKNAIGGAITKSADFEARMSSIKAVTGSSAETMKQFHDAAIKAGADTAFSATEAADAIEELAKAGVSTKDILNGGLTGALNLATAGELDLKEAAEIASTALNAFKRDNLSVVDAANQLAGAANASATDVHELKYGLSAVAPVASGLGLSFKDTTNALAVFAQNGLKGSDAGTSLKTMLMNLQPQTKAQANMMRELGIITEEGSNRFFTAEGKIKSFAEVSQVLKESLSGLTEQQQQQALKTMFGTDAVRAATIAMNEGADGANKMQAEISKVTAAQVAAEKLNNLKGAIEGLSGSFETLQIKLGESVLPLFTTIVKYVDKLVDKFSQSQGIQNFTDAMATINPVLDHFLNGTKLADGVMEKFKGTMSSAAPILGLVGGLLAFGPATKGLTLLTGLLGGLGTKIGALGSILSGGFSSAAGMVGLFAAQVSGLGGVLGGAASKGLSVLSMMTSGISSVMSVALAAIGPAAILGLVVAGLGIINNQFGTQIDQLLNTVTTKGPQIIHNLVQGITNAIPALIASGADLIAKFADAFETMFPVIVNAGVSLIVSLVQGIGQNATSLISSANTILSTFVSSLLNALPTLLSAGMELLANLSQGILNNIPQMMANAQKTVTTFLTGLGQQMPQIIQNGIQILQNLITGIVQSLPTILQIAVQVITSFIQGLVSNLPAIIQGGIQLIMSLVTGLIQNLPQIIASAAQIIVSLVSGLIQAAPQLIMGGLQLIAQLVIGLITGIPKVLEAGWELIKALGGALIDGIVGIGQKVGEFFGGIWDWITGKNEEGASKTKATMDDLTSSVSTKTAEMSTAAKTNTQDMATGVQFNMDTMGLNASNAVNTMGTNVNTSFQNLVTSSNTNMQAVGANVTNGMTQAQTNATLQAQTMQQNVGNSMDLMGLDTLNKVTTMNTNVDANMQALVTTTGINMQALSSNVSSNMQQAQATATAESATMNANVSSNLSGLNTSASSYMQALQTDSNAAFQTVQTNASAISSSTAAAVSGNYNTMSGNATGSTNSMQGSTTSAFTTMQSNAESSSQAVANAVTNNFKNAETAATNAMNGVSKAVTDGMNKVDQAATAGGNKMAQTFDSTLNKVKSSVQQGMSAVSSAFNSGMNQAVSISSSANSQIVAVFNTLASHLHSVGVHAGSGLYNGLASMAGSLYALAYSIASNIASVMRSALDIHSPSRVTDAIGSFTGEGMYNGMVGWVKAIDGVAKDYAMAITDQKYGVDSVVTTSASVNNSGIRSSLENLSDDVKHSQLSDTKFEIHNEMVGDKIYTTVKEKEARDRIKDDYFVYE
jgi:TP901 family phage tail tape measure protein